MNRRIFLKKTALTTAALGVASSFPYILPSGRLFAKTGSQLAQHVVFVLCAGGIRHQESAGQMYLRDSQFEYTGDPDLQDLTGNIMPNLFTGALPTDKIVFGTGPNGQTPINPVLSSSLQAQGAFFKEMRVDNASHYIGLSSLLSGNYAATQGLRQKPLSPTIFEYIRRFMNPDAEGTASKVWFIGNTIGNSVPLLNYSAAQNWGAQYGANFFAPNVTFGEHGKRFLAAAKNYHPEEDFGRIFEMRDFLNNSFLTTGGILESLGNTPEEKFQIKAFMERMYNTEFSTIVNQVPELPIGADPTSVPIINRDVSSLIYATEVMHEFEPTIMALNLDGPDTCHNNFTGYLQALHRADWSIGYLWNFIQNHPKFANNTVLIAAPECGRNAIPNSAMDENDWFAYDHSDFNTQRSWTVMAGPGVPNTLVEGEGSTIIGGTTVPNPVGNNAQIALTIAEILGIRPQVEAEGFVYNNQSLFDLM